MEKVIKGFALILFLSFTLIGCNSTDPSKKMDSKEQKVRQQAQAFFKTFAERNDWEKFCSYYREDLVFRDIILQIDLDSLWQFKRFYKWDEEGNRFAKLSPDQEHLEVETLVVDGNTAVARGHVNPFYYDGNLIDPDWGTDFTIWLRFDDSLKIIEQRDWFEYSPDVLESTVERCRENGFEAIPEWLDLSRED